MAGGKEDDGDSLRQWQVNSDAGTLQGWGITSASPAQAATAESFTHSELAAQTSASTTYCPVVNPLQSEEGAGTACDDTDIDPQRLQAWVSASLSWCPTRLSLPMNGAFLPSMKSLSCLKCLVEVSLSLMIEGLLVRI